VWAGAARVSAPRTWIGAALVLLCVTHHRARRWLRQGASISLCEVLPV